MLQPADGNLFLGKIAQGTKCIARAPLPSPASREEAAAGALCPRSARKRFPIDNRFDNDHVGFARRPWCVWEGKRPPAPPNEVPLRQLVPTSYAANPNPAP